MLTRNPHFMFRDQELARVLDRLADGQSVLLVGIRRTGKTEVLKEVCARLSEQANPTAAVFLDVQDYTSLSKFYGDLLRAMPSDVMDRLQQALASLHLVPSTLGNWIRGQFDTISAEGVDIKLRAPNDDLQRYWEPIAEQLVAILAKTPTTNLPVIIIDELPFFIENLLDRDYPAHDIEVLMASLRKLRSNGLRFVIAGSINLDALLDSLHIPKTVLGGLWRETLPPFTRDQANTYLEHRLRDTTAADYLDVILQHLPDYIPQCLETAVGYVKFNPTRTECELLLQNQVLPQIQRSFVYQFEERLANRYSPDEQLIAEKILDALATAENTSTQLPTELVSGAARPVFIKLQLHDFLAPAADYQWQFSLNALRLWWRSSRGLL
ncbi:MAG: AAA family ATPase [Methylococcaceae bacterium]|nr:AAA family ATPase [Methylococcaceae bacterium]